MQIVRAEITSKVEFTRIVHFQDARALSKYCAWLKAESQNKFEKGVGSSGRFDANHFCDVGLYGVDVCVPATM